MISPFIYICLFSDNGIVGPCDYYDKGDDDNDCDDYIMTVIVVVVVMQEVGWNVQCYPEFVLSKSEQNRTSSLITIVFLDVVGLMW